ncbi:MAG: tRNA pseudouridine(38-40) synthase TruA [Paludibacteraceae bacterium]|nr:tRNA pseudouridine(38-40) synthase TruA [Paludibacteraceae bacterium]
MRYFVEFAYNGSSFHGSQRQPNGITVQEVLEDAFATILREQVALTFAGRTDAGVHAEQMFAHFDCEGLSVTGEGLRDRLNSLLPASIAIRRIFPVTDDAHARFSAIARTYEYRITTVKDPFRQDLVTRVAPGLDFEAMNQAAALLIGKHDFASFCKVHTDVKTTFCDVTRAEWISDTVFTISADRFLRNMVRAVVGTLLEVGKHKMTPKDFLGVIESHNRCAAGQSAPAQGLYLTHILYPESIYC